MPISNGWLITDAGKATLTATAISNDAFYNHGAAFRADGTRFAIADAGSIAATAVLLNGTAHTFDGLMYYVTSLPADACMVNGVVHNARGSVYINTANAPTSFLSGIGMMDDGAMTAVLVA